MQIAGIVLEYLKVLLSPQVIAGSVAVAFIVKFHEDIRALMRRIAKIRFPGGSEVSTTQVERASEEFPGHKTAPPVPPPDQISLPQNLSLTPEEVEQLREAFQAERAKAYLWEYRYLNFYLVPATQRVLDWLASLNPRISYSLFDAFWLPMIPSSEERRAIMRALETHYLIQFQGELVEVTPKGREYIQWRGPLSPQAPEAG